MSYIYTSLKPHLCKDVIGIIEDMVRWEGLANWKLEMINGEIVSHYGNNTLECQTSNLWEPVVKFDANFTSDGHQPLNLSDNPNRYCINVERYLRCFTLPNTYDFEKDVFVKIAKITDHSYALFVSYYNTYMGGLKYEHVFISNDLQTLYNKLRYDAKQGFFHLEPL